MTEEDNKKATHHEEVPDTGHSWDDGVLRELINPPPRWWMIALYISGLVFVGYMIWYVLIPSYAPKDSWFYRSSIKEYRHSLDELAAVRGPWEERLKKLSVTQIYDDAELSRYAVESARVLFGDKCAACHGAGGQGNIDFPVLADDDWLYGGKLENIEETLHKGRQGNMTAFAETLNEQQIDDLVKYVVAMSEGKTHEPGRKLFMDPKVGCYVCHGEDGKGNQQLGSANLTDKIMRFRPYLGQTKEDSIRRTILYGVNADNPNTRVAQMPVFGDKLTEREIKKLTLYVHSLGGGVQPDEQQSARR